jgi:hypothetical protein
MMSTRTALGPDGSDRVLSEVGAKAEAKWRATSIAIGDARAADPLETMWLLTRIMATADTEMELAVKAARLAGRSWSEIGEAAGVSKQTAHNRYSRFDPLRWDCVSPRCEAAGALYRDMDVCEGDQNAVRVWDSERPVDDGQREIGGTGACVRHGAKLYAQLRFARVYPVGGPDRPDHPALEVYHRAQVMKESAR